MSKEISNVKLETKFIFDTLSLNNLAKYILIISITCFVCYFNILFNQFTFDDHSFIKDNKYIKSLEGVYRSTFEPIHDVEAKAGKIEGFRGFNYRPMSFLLMYLIGKLFGITPFSFHLFNIIFHIFNCILALLLCIRLKIPQNIALLIIIIFAVHPIHTDAVASAVGIQEEFVFFFGLSSILFITSEIKFKYVIACILFTAALFSKENGISFFPIIIAVIIFLYLKSEKEFLQKENILKLSAITIIPTIAYLWLRYTILGSLLRHALLPKFTMDNPLYEANSTVRILTSIYLLLKYLLKTILPIKLSSDYAINSIKLVNSITDIRFITALAILLSILYAFIYSIKNRHYLLALCIFIFYAPLIPVSNLLYVGASLFAERYLYLPSLGLCLIIGLIFGKYLKHQSRNIKLSAYIIAGIIICLMTIQTISRNTDWKDDFTLSSSVVKIYPENTRAHYNLGSIYYNSGKYAEAIIQFEKALKINPLNNTAYQALIRAYYLTNNHDKAINKAMDAIKIFPNDDTLYNLLAEIYKRLGNIEKANEIYKEGLEKIGKSFLLNYNLAKNYAELKDCSQAEKYFNEAIAIKDDAKAHYYLALCYYQSHKDKEAIKEFNKLLPFAKEYPEVVKYLAVSYFNIGDYQKAEDLALAYMKIAPYDAEGYALGAKISWKVYEEFKAAKKYMEIAISYDPKICSKIDYITLCIALGF
jgi:tetratricopeptide (TPR) repeat protein